MIKTFTALSFLREDVGMEGRFTADSDLKNGPLIVKCLKFKTDQAQDVKKMEKLNNLFFTLMSRGPDADVSEVTGKEQTEARAGKKGRGRKQ
ncbi:signal recognition particle 9 kDa protein isoform X2 [Populus trichocarpa]|uniref:signal recognition particle 9 kDa protein isoform X2 n=1 Tax=Populus trichocarpa TaxID=3694 RepID=UPI000D18B2B1|nr:signal recognition particle 9 kDa protein isoform X2 [Populus trichocarpa]|eukprot:XP_002306822.3 signal recognition particle 9 kDa protein isoform X2 [Populus trichocarpa]